MRSDLSRQSERRTIPLHWEARLVPPDTEGDLELIRAGYRIYNRWLADFVSVQPERHIGLAYVPSWDIDLAVQEVEWAAEAGLRGVNLPAGRRGIREYDDPLWEPFWSACEDGGLNFGDPRWRSVDSDFRSTDGSDE